MRYSNLLLGIRPFFPSALIVVGSAAAMVAIHQSQAAPGSPAAVGGEPLPLVRIEATRRVAEETSNPLRRLALRGEFTISRLGPANDGLQVFVLFSGTASNGVDYPAPPFLASIPAGESATRIAIVPSIDDLAEGIETVVATLSHCPPDTQPPLGIPCRLGFEIEPAHESATVFIRDDGISQASLRLTQPPDGAVLNWGQAITVEANAIDLDGYISHVEFLDGDQRIGESEIFFIRAPDPGTLITHTFEWDSAAPGPRVLTARAVRFDGTVVTSQQVSITVGPRPSQPVLTFNQPGRNDVFSTLDEIPILLRAFATDDVFLNAEIFANGLKIADASFCCWLCPCAHPLPGMETVLQIPVRPPSGGLSSRPWQGWTNVRAGLYYLTARAVGERGTTVAAGPVRIFVIDRALRIAVQREGTVALTIPEGSLAPGEYDLEASSDLLAWTRLGAFQPGNLAAFYFDRPPMGERRFYRSVFHQTLFP
ncbi:MAG: hypothetical protein HYR88_06800 [Verrucomicrobia bacterium]|nr:hypothetical protein [Verrucomicrobiota bacterium]MBI3867256.1 hypothetical protein [Verrucomicrobiota bacterium]